MEENNPKIEFELGKEVSPGNFFKSSFARSFVSNCHDIKSLDTDYVDNLMSEDHSEGNLSTDTITSNNNYFSLNTFESPTKVFGSIESTKESTLNEADARELNHLRKQCQTLTEENHRLHSVLKTNQVPRIQVMDNVLLQTQVDTLKWQLKQAEANQQMYRSLMRQVARFLDRTKKSLDYVNEKNANRNKRSSSRSNRSQSVYIEESSTNSSTVMSPINSSKFTRAKSVTQIPANGCSGFREFTWSVLRRNDPAHCTPPRVKTDRKTNEDLNKTHEGVVYRRPSKDANSEENGDHVPTEKLSQEAFRLMRTVESLLAMRHPDLAITSSSSFSSTFSSASSSSCASSTHEHTIDDDNNNISLTQFHNDIKGANSTLISDGSFIEEELSFRSLNSTFLNAECKPIEKKEDKKKSPLSSISRQLFKQTGSSTPNSKAKRPVKEDRRTALKDDKTNNINMADDESGFSSMNSFQDVGLPMTTVLSPIKGCHTEIGLPRVPRDKTNHRRWSSTPVELQTLLKKCSNGFMPNRSNVESLSVWV
ncbi:uncharacterized protein LOC107046907 [Diachasma alloeum]|uniref:uncharacterized protein LOC107046907 n=1 Tax=Diachasma alloeum TaxID=454923 RepID=UPI00073826A2|nr:uncharacterized protein LOC107046907 [Diachasma alloeum]